MKRAVGQIPSPGQLAAGKLASGMLAAAGSVWLLWQDLERWGSCCAGFRMRMTFDSDDDADDDDDVGDFCFWIASVF